MAHEEIKDEDFEQSLMNIITEIETLNNNEKKILLVYLLEHMSMNDLWDVMGESIMKLVKNMQGEGGEEDGE